MKTFSDEFVQQYKGFFSSKNFLRRGFYGNINDFSREKTFSDEVFTVININDFSREKTFSDMVFTAI